MLKLIYKLFSLLLLICSLSLQAKVINVSATGEITSIKKALELAEENDTILVNGGVYKEGNILVEKPISLIGINNPILDGNEKNEILTIVADGVLVKGFTLQNLKVDYIKDKAAIKIIESQWCRIIDNIILDTYFGIYLENSDNCIVDNNIISGKAERETSSGNAIHLWYSKSSTIINNKVSGHRDGIYLEFVNNSRIEGNISTNNLRYGLHFMFSNENQYRSNEFINNGAGVAVMYSKNIEMFENIFKNNQGPAAYGILLKDITDSQIERNIFEINTIGILAEGSNRLQLVNNNFIRNGYALKIMGSCESLNLTGNNFIGNTFEIGTNAKNISSHTLEKNFWSSYQGYDLDNDGIGDVPHKPVKLFSYLIEKIPSAVILIKSMFVDLIELAERVTPSLTPDHFADSKPRMNINPWMNDTN
jgi:nitrous oxidase accessory protein